MSDNPRTNGRYLTDEFGWLEQQATGEVPVPVTPPEEMCHHVAWVLMGNDFPEAVFTDKKLADAAVEARRDVLDGADRRIYWRLREFIMNRDLTLHSAEPMPTQLE